MADDDVLRRVPPQSVEAEQSVLGAILLDNDAVNRALELIVPRDFYRETHCEIFRAMTFLADNRQPIDAITLTERLRSAGILEQVGGPAYIAELAESVPTAANIGHYARIVRDRSMLRRFGSVTRDVSGETFEARSTVDVEGFLDSAEKRILDASEHRIDKPFETGAEITRGALRLMEQLYDNREKGIITGVATGFIDLDRLTGGLQPGNLVVIAARPSMGKTALALNILAHVALRGGEIMPDKTVRKFGVAMFSIEMTNQELGCRLLCAEASCDWQKIRAGYIAESDFPRLAKAAAEIADSRMFFDDDSNVTASVLKAKCRRLSRDPSFNLRMVVVDYLQLMRAERTGESRNLDVAEITRSLKSLAKELDLPVVVLSQLNRKVEERSDFRPRMADLRESGAIEQDADVIAFIYREEMYKKDSKEPGVAEIIVAKQRNGPTDTIKLTYVKQFTRFEDYEGHQQEFER